jgi:hypothetical protein
MTDADDAAANNAAPGQQRMLHVVRKADLETCEIYKQWSDPDKLAGFSPEKPAALLANPLSHSGDDPVQLVVTSGDTIAGKVDLIAGEIDVAGQPTPTLWGSALFVAPEYRGSGAEVMLIRKMQGMHPTMSTCGVSQAIHPIYQKLGWNDLEVPRHVLLRRSRSTWAKMHWRSLLPRLPTRCWRRSGLHWR